jgi:hypothetical protein
MVALGRRLGLGGHQSWAYNAKLHETFHQLSNEWQSFVPHRTEENLNVMQRMASARKAELVLEITARFWQEAVDNYARAYAVIFKLAGSCMMCAVEGAQQAAAEVSALARAA